MNNKKSFTILGTSIWKIFAYFIIYSVIGFVIETIFALVFYGVLESRQSFLYGPFCSIYGLGAVCMYIFLNRYLKDKNNHLMFWGGALVGSIVEYLISLVGEIFLHVRWWDYSNEILNINGRICLLYSLFWGLLGVYFMRVINPKVDKIINYIKTKININALKGISLTVVILLIINCVVSGIAINLYLIRQSVKNDLDIPKKEETIEKYNKIYSKDKNVKIINKYFNDEKMVKAYPNLTINLKDGSVIKVRELLPEVKYYYYKFNMKNLKNSLELRNIE